MKFSRIKFPLASAALKFWSWDDRTEWCPAGKADDAWIIADSEDEARSAAPIDGGGGLVSAFGDDGLDRRVR